MDYDLSGKICASLDKHLALAILEFLGNRASSGAAADAVLEAKLALVEKTYMCDYAMDLYCEAHQTKDVRFTCSNRVGVRVFALCETAVALPWTRHVFIVHAL